MSGQVIQRAVPKIGSSRLAISRNQKNELKKTMAERAGLPSTEEKSNEIQVIIRSALPQAQSAEPAKKPRAKRVLTDEQRKANIERLAKAREVKRQKAAEKK